MPSRWLFLIIVFFAVLVAVIIVGVRKIGGHMPNVNKLVESKSSNKTSVLLLEGLTPVKGKDIINMVGYRAYYTTEKIDPFNYDAYLHLKLCVVAKKGDGIDIFGPKGKKILSGYFEVTKSGVVCHTFTRGISLNCLYRNYLYPGRYKIVFFDPLSNHTDSVWYWDVRSGNIKVNWIKVNVTTVDFKVGRGGEQGVAFTLFQISITNKGNAPEIFSTYYFSDISGILPIHGPSTILDGVVLQPHETKVFTKTYTPFGNLGNISIPIPYEKIINGHFEIVLPSRKVKIPCTITPPEEGETKVVIKKL